MNQRPNCCRPMPPQAPCPSRPPCPSCPPTQKGVLLPRILASGREWQRRACVALYVGGLPEDANGRLQLVGVTACGDADWEIAPYQEPRPCSCRGCRPSRPAPCLLRVNIPVVCQVQAECRQVLRGESVLTTDVALPIRCVQAECWRNQMMVLPCVRLIDGARLCVRMAAVPLCLIARLNCLSKPT